MSGQKTFTPTAIYVGGAGLIGKDSAGQAELLSSADVLDIVDALPLAGGTMTGSLFMNAPVDGDPRYLCMLVGIPELANNAAEFAAIFIKSYAHGTDPNAFGFAAVAHGPNYINTTGYTEWVQLYALEGMHGMITGCNTTTGFWRVELGPQWPYSEMLRMRRYAANKPDMVIGYSVNRWITGNIGGPGNILFASVGSFTSGDVGRWVLVGDENHTGDHNTSFVSRIASVDSSTQATLDTIASGGAAAQPIAICDAVHQLLGDGSAKHLGDHAAKSYTPSTLTDAAAANGQIYYSSTQSKLCYKDSGGVVRTLY